MQQKHQYKLFCGKMNIKRLTVPAYACIVRLQLILFVCQIFRMMVIGNSIWGFYVHVKQAEKQQKFFFLS